MQPIVKTISDPQLQSLLKSCHVTWQRAALTILSDTGLRVSELAALRQDDLWFLDAPVKVLEVRAEIAKKARPRSIPLTARCLDAIRDLRAALWLKPPGLDSPWAFPSKHSAQHLTPRTFQRLTLLYGNKALQSRLTPHMLRHTFATRLMRKTNIRVVQELLGHKSLGSTQIYTHPNSQDLKQAIDTLEA